MKEQTQARRGESGAWEQGGLSRPRTNKGAQSGMDALRCPPRSCSPTTSPLMAGCEDRVATYSLQQTKDPKGSNTKLEGARAFAKTPLALVEVQGLSLVDRPGKGVRSREEGRSLLCCTGGHEVGLGWGGRGRGSETGKEDFQVRFLLCLPSLGSARTGGGSRFIRTWPRERARAPALLRIPMRHPAEEPGRGLEDRCVSL